MIYSAVLGQDAEVTSEAWHSQLRQDGWKTIL